MRCVGHGSGVRASLKVRKKETADQRRHERSGRRPPYQTPSLPAGTFALLLTDIESSTALWEAQPSEMREAIRRHDELLTKSIAACNGRILTDRGEGDSYFAIFSRPSQALAAAVNAQKAISEENWPTASPLRVRMAIHTAEAGPDYRGPDVNRCARLRALAGGGQVLVSEPAAELMARALPDGVSLVDLGPVRLRDFPTPIRVFEVILANVLSPFGLHTAAGRAGVPVSLRRFVGRDIELAQLPIQFRTHRLLTLVGPGGIGKTSLALEIARELTDELRPIFVDLAAVSDPSLLLGSLAGAVGVRDLPGRSQIELLMEALDSAPTLLVLDNCEHLLTRVSELVKQLLASAPSLRVLATCREALGIVGEVRHLVEPLARAEAVELFCDRAADAKPGYTMGSDDLTLIESIADRLDGMPLALELAAARVSATSLAQLADHLDRAIQAQPRKEGASGRHETMRAALDWGYRLLTDHEQVLLRRLAIFNAGFGLDGAEAVCGTLPLTTTSIFEVIVSLVERSFVSVALSRPEPRYRLLEPVRQFAESHLSGSERTDLELSFFNWASRFVSLLPRDLFVSREGLALTKEEMPNLTAALAMATELHTGEAIEAALRLEPYWLATGSVREAIAIIDRCLSRHSARDSVRADGLRTVGGMRQAAALGDLGVESCREAVAIYESLGMTEAAGEARIRFGAALATAGNPAGLEQLATAARNFRAAGERRQLARALHRRAFFARRLGLMSDDIRRGLEESLEIAKADQFSEREVLVESELATLATADGQVGEAAAHLRRAAAARRGDATIAISGQLLVAAGELALVSERWEIALEHFGARHAAVERGVMGETTSQQADLAQKIMRAREKLSDTAADEAWARGVNTPIERIVGGLDGTGPEWLIELSESPDTSSSSRP